jgi:glutathione S-transferase
MKYKLVSFKLCPFVQRSVITLLHKDVPYKIEYIDLAEPPDWFKQKSPLGKVPLLIVDDDTVLFESAVINEFIDETTDSPMHPQDPLARAQNRAWIEFGSVLLGDNFRMSMAKTEADHGKAQDQMLSNLSILENAFSGDGPFFNGKRLSLVDTAFAPLFMRLSYLAPRNPRLSELDTPRLNAWAEHLLELPAVRLSVVSDFEELYRAFLARPAGYAAGIYG